MDQLGWKIQIFTKRLVRGLVNYVSVVAYLFCVNLPAAFSQPRTSLLVKLCSYRLAKHSTSCCRQSQRGCFLHKRTISEGNIQDIKFGRHILIIPIWLFVSDMAIIDGPWASRGTRRPWACTSCGGVPATACRSPSTLPSHSSTGKMSPRWKAEGLSWGHVISCFVASLTAHRPAYILPIKPKATDAGSDAHPT